MRVSFTTLVRTTVQRSIADDIDIAAGYASYTTLLSFFPFIIFLMAAAGQVSDADTSKQVIHYALTYLPKEIAVFLSPLLQTILGSDMPELLTIGGIGALWVASSGIEGLRYGLNKVYGETELRPWWKRRLQSITIVVTGSAIFAVLVIILILWPFITILIAKFSLIPVGDLEIASYARIALSAFLLSGLLCCLYKLLPHGQHVWRNIWPGAMLATCLWILLAHLFSLYLANVGEYDATYGSIGGVIILLLFFHYSTIIILFGAELNQVLEDMRSNEINIKKGMP